MTCLALQKVFFYLGNASLKCFKQYVFILKYSQFFSIVGAPRRRTNDSYLTTFKDQEARLSFEMMAYPQPYALSIFDKTPSLNVTIYRNIEHKNVAQFSCVSEKLYMVFCTLILHNQTVFHAGFYDATFKNSQGNVTFMFEIKEETDLSTPPIEVAGRAWICLIIQLICIEMNCIHAYTVHPLTYFTYIILSHAEIYTSQNTHTHRVI